MLRMLQRMAVAPNARDPHSLRMRMAAALDDKMVRQGRTDTWLASQLGVSKSTIGRLRRGEIEITFDYARTIERALDLEAGQLLREGGYFDSSVAAEVVEITGRTRRTATAGASLDPTKKRAARKKPQARS